MRNSLIIKVFTIAETKFIKSPLEIEYRFAWLYFTTFFENRKGFIDNFIKILMEASAQAKNPRFLSRVFFFHSYSRQSQPLRQ